MTAPEPAPAPSGWRSWVAGARPRTLPAAVVPVLVGTACVTGEHDVILLRALAAGVVALALQIGTNFANDYSDGVRGTDDPGRRVGDGKLRDRLTRRRNAVSQVQIPVGIQRPDAAPHQRLRSNRRQKWRQE